MINVKVTKSAMVTGQLNSLATNIQTTAADTPSMSNPSVVHIQAREVSSGSISTTMISTGGTRSAGITGSGSGAVPGLLTSQYPAGRRITLMSIGTTL